MLADDDDAKGWTGGIETEINFERVAAVSRLLSTNFAASVQLKNRASPSGPVKFHVGWHSKSLIATRLSINHASRWRRQFAIASSNAFLSAVSKGVDEDEQILIE